MMEPQPLTTTIPTDDLAEFMNPQTALSLETTDSALNFERVCQTIVKGLEPVVKSCTSTELIELLKEQPSPTISTAVWLAWQQLVNIIAQLCSPQGGWPSNLPQTPENLIPYVTEEVSEILEALYLELTGEDSGLRKQENTELQGEQCILIEDLIPKLLWSVAKSSCDIMRLLAGVKVNVWSAENQGQSQGILRLSVILICENPNPWSIDLATLQVASSSLPSDVRIQWYESPWTQQPVSCETLGRLIIEKIQNVNPEISYFINSVKVNFLEPGKPWQAGNLKLDFHLELMLENQLNFKNKDLSYDSSITQLEPFSSDTETKTLQSEHLFSLVDSQIRLSTEESVETYKQIVLKQKLIEILSGLEKKSSAMSQEYLDLKWPSFSEDRKSNINLELVEFQSTTPVLGFQSLGFNPYSLVTHLVNSAWEVGTWINYSALLSTQIHPELILLSPHLTFELLWQIIKSSYGIMQLIGGVKAQVLRPIGSWETGILRLIAILQADIPNLQWKVDIATGQLCRSKAELLTLDAIIASCESKLCQTPIVVRTLANQIIGYLRRTSPEIEMWMDEMMVDFQYPQVLSSEVEKLQIEFSSPVPDTNSFLDGVPTQAWLPGTLRLKLGFEFIQQRM